jgi:hypothetical protein
MMQGPPQEHNVRIRWSLNITDERRKMERACCSNLSIQLKEEWKTRKNKIQVCIAYHGFHPLALYIKKREIAFTRLSLVGEGI